MAKNWRTSPPETPVIQVFQTANGFPLAYTHTVHHCQILTKVGLFGDTTRIEEKQTDCNLLISVLVKDPLGFISSTIEYCNIQCQRTQNYEN